MAIHRMGFALHTQTKEILDSIVEETGLTQSAVIECLLYGVGNPGAAAVVVRQGAELRDATLQNERELRKEAKQALKHMDAAQLKSVIKGKE